MHLILKLTKLSGMTLTIPSEPKTVQKSGLSSKAPFLHTTA